MPSVSKSFQELAPVTRGLTRRQTLTVLMPLVAGHYSVYAQTELTDLARIRASGMLKIAVYKDNAPFSDGATADMRGLDVALAEALAIRGADGISVANELHRTGYAGQRPLVCCQL